MGSGGTPAASTRDAAILSGTYLELVNQPDAVAAAIERVAKEARRDSVTDA